MKIELGIKSDPIHYRYSYDWLFDLMKELDCRFLQLGSFPEMYTLEDEFFRSLRKRAEQRGVVIRSCFSSYRELGGFLSGDSYLAKATWRNYERFIQIAAALGADSVGSNPGSVYRDRMESKESGIETYLEKMKKLMALACRQGLKFLAIEPMSSLAEPPSLPEEIDRILGTLEAYYLDNCEVTVPVFTCADISHGVADKHGTVIHDNLSLFEYQIPYMAEFHFKNTDARFEATFGFSEAERKNGIVDLAHVQSIIDRNRERFPVDAMVGYLELSGPKLGRDYSDPALGEMIGRSIDYIRRFF